MLTIRSRLVWTMIATLTLVGSGVATTFAAEEAAEAAACITEVEPNDVVADAATIAGEQCVAGTLIEVDDTDIFVWQVTAAEAASDWTLTLAGLPDVATTLEVVQGDGDTAVPIASLETGPGSEPVARDVSVEEGTYALVVSRADRTTGVEPDQLGYELRIARAASDVAGPTDTEDETARIVVVTTDAALPRIGGDVAVEMVQDTSASMRQRVGKSTKIGIAKRSLVGLVDDLPAGLPVALRTFTSKPDTCATALRVPLQPLRPNAMKRVIRETSARKGVKTPIAKALSRVPRDLGDAGSHRLVVLVTDGREDCDGDPAAAIAALSAAGYTTTVHVIGLALDDDDVRDTLAEWAALGGGRYLDAPDRAGLAAALQTAFTAPYLVFDEEGTLVAQGLTGDDGVEVEASVYRVDVLTDPPQTFEAVDVEAGAQIELPLGGDGAAAG